MNRHEPGQIGNEAALSVLFMWVEMLNKRFYILGDYTMRKKIIFMDLDGTIIDHSINAIPENTIKTIKLLKEQGHTLVIATGRPPCLFYDIEHTLDIDTFIAANGRYVKYKGKEIYTDYIDPVIMKQFVSDMIEQKIEVGFEAVNVYAIHNILTDLPSKFSDYYHLEMPIEIKDFHLHNKVLQMIIFYDKKDYSHISKKYPMLDFNISCPYGIDINNKGGMKEVGMNEILSILNFKKEDVIAIGDGFNDISMIEAAGFGIAMGNGCIPLKEKADYVTDNCNDDGFYKAFKKLGMVK